MTEVAPQEIAFGSVGLDPGRCHLLVATDATLSLLPKSLPASWSKLAVAVLHSILLDPIFGIDDLVLHSGRAVTYAHEAEPAFRAVRNGEAALWPFCSIRRRSSRSSRQRAAVTGCRRRAPISSRSFQPARCSTRSTDA